MSLTKRQQRRLDLRNIPNDIKWCIKTFDEKKSISFDVDKNGLYDFSHLRNQIIDLLLPYYLKNHLISQEQCKTMILQLKSTDRDDWYITLLLINQIKQPRFK